MLESTSYCQVPMCDSDELYLLLIKLHLIRNTFFDPNFWNYSSGVLPLVEEHL